MPVWNFMEMVAFAEAICGQGSHGESGLGGGLLRTGALLCVCTGEESGTHTWAIAVWGMLELLGPWLSAELGAGGWWH